MRVAVLNKSIIQQQTEESIYVMVLFNQQFASYHVSENTPINQDDNDVKPLPIMFEILQTWDESLAVFEALRT